MSEQHTLWTEKYRPTLEEYVWKDDFFKSKCEEWIKNKEIPNILMSGSPGTGKTSIALALLNKLEVPPEDILFLNASRERNIEMVQTRIINFCSTWSMFGSFKYVVLDEADSLSILAQKMLRGEIEKHSSSVRFIVTCNYKNKIEPALHSRLQAFEFSSLNQEEYAIRLMNILEKENVVFDTEQIIQYMEKAYPDLRKGINLLQQYTVDGTLHNPEESDDESLDWQLSAINLFKTGRVTEGRKTILASAQPEEYEDVYRLLYDNLDIFSDEDEALLIIRNGLVNHGLVADVEINLAATLVALKPHFKK